MVTLFGWISSVIIILGFYDSLHLLGYSDKYMYSNVSELNDMLLSVHHLYTEFRSLCNVSASFSQSTSLPICVSSAKLDRKDATTSSSMSPINMRNIKGPRTDPWGTLYIPFNSDTKPLVCSKWPQWCQLSNEPLMKGVRSIVFRRSYAEIKLGDHLRGLTSKTYDGKAI